MRWHDDDTFWTQIQARIFTSERMEGADGEVQRLIELLELPPGAKILDLPCGVGVHSLELAARDFEVTGVDRTAAYLDIARERARERGLELQWVCGDMRTFQSEPVYDAVLNLFTSFGYFEDIEDERRTAANYFFAALKPGGKVLFELMSREILARIFRERDWQPLEDGTLFLEEHRIARDWTWMDNRWIVVRDGRQHEMRFGHHVYSAAGLSDLLRSVGFGHIGVFGSLSGAPYDHQAERLVVRAVKP